MNHATRKLLLACTSALCLAACGGGDVQDRLDVADPAVRFVDASANAPALTLYREDIAQPDATDVSYKFASDYFDVDASFADWTVKTAVGGAVVDSASIDAARGTKYTIVALPTSDVATGLYVIADPYNKPVGSNSTRLRLMNARFGAGAVDLYMNAPGTDIAAAGVDPLIAATAYKTAGPASGSDSVDIPAGTYQLTIAEAGAKRVLFKGQLAFGDNEDVLLVALHDAVSPGTVRMLMKVEGTGGLFEVLRFTPL
jgi:hypothetical protein